MSLAKRLLVAVRRVNKGALRVDILTAATLGLVGDVACQRMVEEAETFDARRFYSIGLFSGIYVGCGLHFIYKTYPVIVKATARHILTRSKPHHATAVRYSPAKWAHRARDVTTLSHSAGCAVVDNLHNGFIYIPAYFLGVGLLQGDGWNNAVTNLFDEWMPTYLSCSVFWIPYMWLNFQTIPARYRVRFMVVGNLFWCVVIDHLAHRK